MSKRDTETMKVGEGTLGSQHNSRQFLFLCVLQISGIAAEVEVAVGFTAGRGRQPCLSSRAYKQS